MLGLGLGEVPDDHGAGLFILGLGLGEVPDVAGQEAVSRSQGHQL